MNEEKEEQEQEEEEEEETGRRFPRVVEKLIKVLSTQIGFATGDNTSVIEDEKENDEEEKENDEEEKETENSGETEMEEDTPVKTHVDIFEPETMVQERKMSDAEIKQKMKLDLEAMIEKQVLGQMM